MRWLVAPVATSDSTSSSRPVSAAASVDGWFSEAVRRGLAWAEGKDEILATLFNEALDELLSATAPVYEDPARDLERLIRHHVAFALENRHLVNVYQREDRSLVDPWERHFDRRRRQYIERWEAIVSRCFPRATPAEIAAGTQACLGVIFSIAYWPAKLAEMPGLAELVADFARKGLTALTATSA